MKLSFGETLSGVAVVVGCLGLAIMVATCVGVFAVFALTGSSPSDEAFARVMVGGVALLLVGVVLWLVSDWFD